MSELRHAIELSAHNPSCVRNRVVMLVLNDRRSPLEYTREETVGQNWMENVGANGTKRKTATRREEEGGSLLRRGRARTKPARRVERARGVRRGTAIDGRSGVRGKAMGGVGGETSGGEREMVKRENGGSMDAMRDQSAAVRVFIPGIWWLV